MNDEEARTGEVRAEDYRLPATVTREGEEEEGAIADPDEAVRWQIESVEGKVA